MPSPKSGKAGTAKLPIDPRKTGEADNAKSGSLTQVQAKAIQKKSGKYGLVKVKPRIAAPKKPPILLPAPTCPAPLQKSERPCGIGELSVQCEHGRKPGLGGVLQVVADTKVTSTIEKKWGLVTVKLSKKCAGEDKLHTKVICREPGASGRKQLSFLETAGSPSEREWKAKDSDDFIALPSTDNDIWTINARPRIYYVHGRGCDDSSQQITIESYPSQQYSFELNVKFFDDWVKSVNKGWQDWGATFMGASPIDLTPKITGPAGSLSGKWGWKEDKDWQVYFEISADIGLDPIFGIGISLEVSFVKIAATANGIPPFLSDLISKHLADIIFSAGADTKAKFKGGPRACFYANGNEHLKGEAAFEVEGTITVKINGRLGSDYVVSASVSLGGETKIEGKAKAELERQGLFLQPSVKLKPLQIKLVVKLKAFSIYSKEEEYGEYSPWGKSGVDIYKGERTKVFPGDDTI